MVLEQLAASLPECREVGVGRVQDRRELRLGLLMGLVVGRVSESNDFQSNWDRQDKPLVVRDRYRKRIRGSRFGQNGSPPGAMPG